MRTSPSLLALTPSRRRTLIVLLALAGVINYADRQMIAVLKPLIEQDLGWTDDTYGRLVSVFQFASAVAYLGAGWLVDRIGLKWANPLGVGSFSLAAAAHAFARTAPQFVLARVALGATESLGTPAAIKSVAAWFEAKQRAVALGFINAANNLGAIATPLLIPGIALAFGWRACFIVTGAVGLAWAATWIYISKGMDLGDGISAAGSAAPRGMWRAAVCDRRTWAIVGAKVLSDQVWWLLLFWTPDLLHRTFHLGLQSLGVPVAAIYLVAMMGSIGGGFISSRFVARGMSVVAARKVTLLGFALLGTALIFVLHAATLWAVVALLSLGVAAQQGFSVNLFSLITDVIPESRVGTVTSLGALCGNLAGMTVLWLLGRHLAAGGTFAPFLDFSAVAFILAVGWLQLLLPTPRGLP